MERKSKPNDIRWKKLSGFLRLPNRIIKPGDIFWAAPEDIPPAFRDTCVPLDPEDAKKLVDPLYVPEADIPALLPKFTIRQRENQKWFDIFDIHGKQMNEKGLTKEKAEEYLNSLQS